jgi:hypothetical protein
MSKGLEAVAGYRRYRVVGDERHAMNGPARLRANRNRTRAEFESGDGASGRHQRNENAETKSR